MGSTQISQRMVEHSTIFVRPPRSEGRRSPVEFYPSKVSTSNYFGVGLSSRGNFPLFDL